MRLVDMGFDVFQKWLQCTAKPEIEKALKEEGTFLSMLYARAVLKEVYGIVPGSMVIYNDPIDNPNTPHWRFHIPGVGYAIVILDVGVNGEGDLCLECSYRGDYDGSGGQWYSGSNSRKGGSGIFWFFIGANITVLNLEPRP